MKNSIPKILLLLATILAPLGAQAQSTCHKNSFFGKMYLFCDSGKKFGPFESATDCVVATAFHDYCKETSAPLSNSSALVPVSSERSCKELKSCLNSVCKKFFMNGDDGTSFNRCAREQCGISESDGQRCSQSEEIGQPASEEQISGSAI